MKQSLLNESTKLYRNKSLNSKYNYNMIEQIGLFGIIQVW